ncbi:hypothetical protein V8C34DRAFT_73061 [Trichoderma compactum]
MAEEGEGVSRWPDSCLGRLDGRSRWDFAERRDQTQTRQGSGQRDDNGESINQWEKEVWRHGICKSANKCKCIGREYLVLAPRGESHGHPSCTQPISCTGSACTHSSITFCPGSCICYNAKDPSALANRRLEPAIGCCGGALSRHPGAASDFTAPMASHGLPWCCAQRAGSFTTGRFGTLQPAAGDLRGHGRSESNPRR